MFGIAHIFILEAGWLMEISNMLTYTTFETIITKQMHVY